MNCRRINHFGQIFVSSFVMRADSDASARNNENYERFVALAGPAAGVAVEVIVC